MNEKRIDLSVEVPASPEQVWEAIATGPGISSWMHPTELEERAGGEYSWTMGFGPSGSGVITEYDRPHRFAQRAQWRPHTESIPPATLATEWIVAARDGGSSVVRMVMSGFGDPEDGWDEEIEGMTEGMTRALEFLRLYLAHFRGRQGTWLHGYGMAGGDWESAWSGFTSALGFGVVEPGARLATRDGLPPLGGTVERVLDGKWHRTAMLLLDSPAPGIASLGIGGIAQAVGFSATLFGPRARQITDDQAARWQTWMQENYPWKE
ncbi:SRPBCC family protein [Sciscionella sediminilitoris]|uniref:SRPBCC family protein n=1 Tax=Sciscionella sediminilitoris TaxID=1445613 RepID=UPI00068FB001|nr:SRPBCC domain-containing protein [Sciscionella sp. SE31]